MSAVAGRGPTSKGLGVSFASRASGARVVRSVGVRPEAPRTSAVGAHEGASVIEADSDFVRLQLGQLARCSASSEYTCDGVTTTSASGQFTR